MTSSPFTNTATAQITIRSAQKSDRDDLWRWRNDTVTKANSLNTNDVPFDQHCMWFESVLSDQNQLLKLGLLNNHLLSDDQLKIGMVKFEVVPINGLDSADENSSECTYKAIVSINVNPKYRGKGLSVPLLRSATESFVNDINFSSLSFYKKVKYVEATIKVDNKASIKCFEKAGFKLATNTKNQIHQTNSENASQKQFLLLLL